MKIAITGAAGFIAFHVARALLADGHAVSGMDSFTGHDPDLARQRLALLLEHPEFEFVQLDLSEAADLQDWLTRTAPDVVLHLAAEAGARTSFADPGAYVRANMIGTLHLLEACRVVAPAHLLIASSSSVYGANELPPSAETDRTDFPVSFYAATKSSAESMSHAYSHAFDIPTTCLRLFTVYGPWGRPDMALFTFVRLILEGEPIELYGDGQLMRDFTYVADVVDAVLALIPLTPAPGQAHPASDSLSPVAPWRTVNVAGSQPVLVTELVSAVEASLGTVAEKVLLPRQQGDVVDTHADVGLLTALTGLKLQTPVGEGVAAFVEWHRAHYRV
ncbi:NAD-dependent epimerase/dehydratase family protein [Nocardioides zhouii]|uniref:NAD-dependent epimerase/dehydratase family protein n=1 Tax=Nocardioides zhouii TaxID=1168729 RepID=A0A4V1RNG8_9ACTN|nr:NAD-dependent epimerase/dehydratase family protein [Nocardioides zhouii]RYC05807.1 NAD-dependent epimerase/dehydratase family protein [Nocardioides zhouii]